MYSLIYLKRKNKKINKSLLVRCRVKTRNKQIKNYSQSKLLKHKEIYHPKFLNSPNFQYIQNIKIEKYNNIKSR